jgi:hypothetical protein
LTAVATAFVLGVILLWTVPAAFAAPGTVTFTFSGRGAAIAAPDWGYHIAADGSGNVTFGGDASVDAATQDIYTYHFDSAGVPQWGGLWTGTHVASSLSALTVGPVSGNIYAVGVAIGLDGGSDYAVLGWQPDGTLLIDTLWAGPKKNDEALAVTTDGTNVYVTGMSQGLDGDMDILTVKYDGAGTVLWARRYNGRWDHQDRGLALVVRGSYVYVAGVCSRPDHSFDTVLLKYTTGGRRMWSRTFDSGNGRTEWVSGVVATGSGVYVCGYGRANASLSSSDALLLKYSATGNRVWAKWVAGARGGRDAWTDIGVTPGGALDVTGSIHHSATGTDIATASYRSAGTRRWIASFSSVGDQEDTGSGIAVASDGRSYIGGSIAGAADPDLAGICYADDGAIDWFTPWDSGFGADYGNDVTVTSNYAWVVGSQATPSFGDDIVVVGFER